MRVPPAYCKLFEADRLTQERIGTPGPIYQNGRVNHLAATGASPSIKGTNKIIELFSEHATLAAWTFHDRPSLIGNVI